MTRCDVAQTYGLPHHREGRLGAPLNCGADLRIWGASWEPRRSEQALESTTTASSSRARSRRSGNGFKLTPSGRLTTLHAFECSIEGCFPSAGLIQASDGNFYGTVAVGGPGGGGGVFRVVGRLSGPTKVWVGLKNSDDVGLRLDLLTEVFLEGKKVGEGRVDNVRAGGSGFNKAVLNSIPIAVTGPADFPVLSTVEVKVSVRRTCSGGGHPSGPARLWYNGQSIDSGAKKDAGSRLDVVSGNLTTRNFLPQAGGEHRRNEGHGCSSIVATAPSLRARPVVQMGTLATVGRLADYGGPMIRRIPLVPVILAT